jgi:hypothetical protein
MWPLILPSPFSHWKNWNSSQIVVPPHPGDHDYTPRNEVRGVYWIQRVRLSVRPSSRFSVFRTYFGLNMQIMKWNLVWLFPMMSYRSSLSFIVIDQYLPELSPLDLEFSWKLLFSGHILDYFFGYWNETWYDCLQWWRTDQVWVSLLLINICLSYHPWTWNFHENFCFPDIFGYW